MIVCDGCGKAGGAEVQVAKVESGRNEPIGATMHFCRNCKEAAVTAVSAAITEALAKVKK